MEEDLARVPVLGGASLYGGGEDGDGVVGAGDGGGEEAVWVVGGGGEGGVEGFVGGGRVEDCEVSKGGGIVGYGYGGFADEWRRGWKE